MVAVLRLLFWSWTGAVVVASELSPTSSGRKDGLKFVKFIAHQIYLRIGLPETLRVAGCGSQCRLPSIKISYLAFYS